MTADCPLCIRLASPTPVDVVWEFPNAIAYLGPWQAYPGYCILVSRVHIAEFHHVNASTRHAFADELCNMSRAIELAFQPRKLNVESLGNQVPHLHWHLFPRTEDDPERLKAVWLALDRAEHDPIVKARLERGRMSRPETIALLRRTLETL